MATDPTIKLNNSVVIDLPKLIESRLVILANSGAGKSWLIRRIAEQAVGKIQTIILDPEGEFSTLREKYDFIHAGKDADVPAEPKSAAMLAFKLLELGTSAIVDLYELHPQERQRFVKLFCEAMVNCPKDLYHPVLVVLDEAHDYVPEGKPSEATYAVEALASKGRKRGQCLILASQRISKLSKNAAAECNNKLIGRASQDIDMKRAGEELGLSKDKMIALRQLKPGEFYAFGPAIADDVQKITIGDVKTTHAKVGYGSASAKITSPSAAIKKVLDKLKDLPKEAEQEARTVAELKQQVKTLTTQLESRPTEKVAQDPHANERTIKAALAARDRQFARERAEWQRLIRVARTAFSTIGQALPKKLEEPSVTQNELFEAPATTAKIAPPLAPRIAPDVAAVSAEGISGPEQRILNAIAWMESIGVTEPEQTAVAFLADYTYGGGGFNNTKGALRTKALIEYRGSRIALTDAGRAVAQTPDQPLSTEELHQKVLARLPGPEQRVLKPLLTGEEMSGEDLAAAAGYTFGSGGFNNPKGRLRSLGLIEYLPGGRVKAAPLLFI